MPFRERWLSWALGLKIMGLRDDSCRFRQKVQKTKGFPMKSWIPLTLSLVLCAAVHAQESCNYPRPPDAPPDGNTATKDQMIAARTDFNRYNGEMNTYLDCLKVKIDAITVADVKGMTDDQKKANDQQRKVKEKLVQQNNAAVDELQANVGRFNEQLKIFKAKQQKS
jgi:hypothetical protein